MIRLFLSRGRLGNQVIQILNILRLDETKKGFVILLGFDSCKKVVTLPRNFLCIPRVFWVVLRTFLKLVGRYQIFLDAFEASISYRSIETIVSLVSREKLLNTQLNIPVVKTPFGVLHWRRGDYLSWPSVDNPAVLSEQFIIRAVKKLSSKPDYLWYVISDDHEIDVGFLRNLGFNVKIFVGSEVDSLKLLASSSVGVLSPSSFSLLGVIIKAVWFYGEKDSQDIFSNYIAPRFWIGHTCRCWFPCDQGIQSLNLRFFN